MGITQATLSRWERGHHRLTEEAERKLARLLRARLDSAGDSGLRRLIENSTQQVHLICYLSHRLLAASPPRVVGWTVDLAEIRGRSLWRFATDEIRAAESRLGELGWYDDVVAQVKFDNGANDSAVVPIESGLLVWERLHLSDGTLARLVTSL